MIKNLPAALLLAAVGTTATAQNVEFTFPVTGESGLTTRTFTDATTGLQLTIDNPRDNTAFSNNSFSFILGGLFIDGGLAPTLDLTFSEDVRLVEYTVANIETGGGTFDLTQAGTSSFAQSVGSLGLFAFNNTSSIFAGGSPISLTSSDNDGEGYSISRIVVELAPSLIGDDYIARVDVGGSPASTVNDTALIGPDAIGNWFGQIGYDVEARSITVNSLLPSTGSSWAGNVAWTFSDLDFLPPGFKIVGVNVTNAAGAGWSSIDNSDLSFTDDSVTINAAEIGGAFTALDQTVTVELSVGPVTNFIGDDYIANYYYFGGLQQTRNDTALVGPDAIGNFQSIINYNIEPDNTLKINSTAASGGWVQGQMWEFLDLDVVGGGQIIDVIVIAASGTGWSNIDNADISFTADSILVDAADIVGITPALDQSVTLQIITSADPVCTGDIADDFGTLGADGQVSFGDFLALLGLIGPCPGGNPGCDGDIADDFGTIGGDGQVSFGDFLALLGLIGPCP